MFTVYSKLKYWFVEQEYGWMSGEKETLSISFLLVSSCSTNFQVDEQGRIHHQDSLP